MFFAAVILAAPLLFALPAPIAARPFQHVPRKAIPRSLEPYFCSEKKGHSTHLIADCLVSFRKSADVWKAVVSDTGVVAWRIFPGYYFSGSGGPNFTLLRRRGEDWLPLLSLCSGDAESQDCEDGWQTTRSRSEVLPIMRSRYYDLRIEVDRCVKWNGRAYVDYQPTDYQQLLPAWFDATSFNEAEIFWTIRYAGSSSIAFEPQWFPIPANAFISVEDLKRSEKSGQPFQPPSDWRPLGEMPYWPSVVFEDPEQNLRWVGVLRGATWGIRGNQGFLLHPRRAYLGTNLFQLVGDWLYTFEGTDDDEEPVDALARYNRRTHQLELRNNE